MRVIRNGMLTTCTSTKTSIFYKPFEEFLKINVKAY